MASESPQTEIYSATAVLLPIAGMIEVGEQAAHDVGRRISGGLQTFEIVVSELSESGAMPPVSAMPRIVPRIGWRWLFSNKSVTTTADRGQSGNSR
jgi:hypothetical protein